MKNNDILRRLRFALNQTDSEVRRLCQLAGQEVSEPTLQSYLAREGEPHFVACPDQLLAAFLDGLVLHRRGPGPPRPSSERLDNNLILKKLRVALEFKEPDMLAVLRLGGMDLSPSELGALFRSPTHKHYRPCGDQLLRNFLKGLTVQLRGVGSGEA